jgi:hypothetical protein
VDGTTLVLCGMKFSIVSRRAAYVRNPPGVKEQAAWGLRKVSESTFNRALLVPFAVTSRHFRDVRINQRIDSLPCPALFSMFPGRLARFTRDRSFERPRVTLARIHQTTTISLARLELRLDYVGVGGKRWGGEVGSG